MRLVARAACAHKLPTAHAAETGPRRETWDGNVPIAPQNLTVSSFLTINRHPEEKNPTMIGKIEGPVSLSALSWLFIALASEKLELLRVTVETLST